MPSLLQRADRILRHPWTTRVGAIQAIVSAGVLAAGLAGGAVTLVFGFPLGWAILTAAGAFGLAVSAAATLIDAYRHRGAASVSSQASELASIARLLSGELEEAQDKLHVAVNTHEWWPLNFEFPSSEWEKFQPQLAAADGDAHKAMRDAHRKLGELNRRQGARWPTSVYEPKADPRMSQADLTLAGEAFSRVLNAKEHLGRLEQDVPR